MNPKISDSTCSCAVSSYQPSERSNIDINVYAWYDSRTPHINPRKNYKPEDLTTTGAQCNYDTSAVATNAFQVQCDMPCSAVNKANAWANERDACPHITKYASAPGITVDPNCKCNTKCSHECQQLRAASAVDNTKKKNISICPQYNCKLDCTQIQANSSIAPLASLSKIPRSIPKTTASELCVECQCSGMCSVPCLMKKLGIQKLITPDELKFSKDTCETCDCSGVCNEVCEEMKRTRDPNRPRICDPCKCTSICTYECTKKNLKPDDICLCMIHCQTGCSRNPLMQKQNVSMACELCDCVGECNDECILKQKEQNKAAVIEGREEAKAVARKFCEECVCNATCIPECQEQWHREESKPMSTPTKPPGPAHIVLSVVESEHSERIGPLTPIQRTEPRKVYVTCDCTDKCAEQCEKLQPEYPTKSGMSYKPETEPTPIQQTGSRKVHATCDCTDKCLEQCAKLQPQYTTQPGMSYKPEKEPTPIQQTGPRKVHVTCDCTDKCAEQCEKLQPEYTTKPGMSYKPEKEPTPIQQTGPRKVHVTCDCTDKCAEQCEKLQPGYTTKPGMSYKPEKEPTPLQQTGPKNADIICDCTDICGEECKKYEVQQCEELQPEYTTKPGVSYNPEKEPIPIQQTVPKEVDVICDCADICGEECEKYEEEPTKFYPNKNVNPIQPLNVATQVKGIIENFDDQNITSNMPYAPILREEKEISSCNVAGEVICENCLCDLDMCNSKCAAVREIKSISEFPPPNTICKICTCVNKCTFKCEQQKSGLYCKTKDNEPIVCSSPVQRGVACINCEGKDPCSPECRERRALAFGREQLENPHVAPADTTQDDWGKRGNEYANAQAYDTATLPKMPAQTSNDKNKYRDHTTSTVDGQAYEKTDRACGEPEAAKGITTHNQQAVNETDPTTCSCPTTDNQPECSLCKKLRGYLSNMFQRDKGGTDRYKTHADDTICYCPKETLSKLDKRTPSYTERLQEMMGQMHSACDEAEFAALPYIKAQSAFELNVQNQQEAIISLLHKCRQKDNYIEALIAELLGRSESLAFDKLKSRLTESYVNAPDFDRSLITNALNITNVRTSVCGADLRNFEITSIKRVGAASLLVKWAPPVDNRIIGYEVYVNSMLKIKIKAKECVCCILDALEFSTTITIEVYAIMNNGRATPSAIAYYAK